MDSIKRIKEFEAILDEANLQIKEVKQAISKFLKVQADIKKLEDYYKSSEYLEDLDLDSNHLLPSDLKRGILSEDAIYDMLIENDQLMAVLKKFPKDLEDYFIYELRE